MLRIKLTVTMLCAALCAIALAATGTHTPERAAEVWARGVRLRSGAMQYSVMSNALGRVYAAGLEELGEDWVTGVSSPRVDSFTLSAPQETADGVEITVTFSLATSTGPWTTLSARLTLVQENGLWRVSAIEADDELYPYTRYRPA